jgi:hypothetical protein
MTGNELGVSGLPKKLWSKISINSKVGKQKAEKAYRQLEESACTLKKLPRRGRYANIQIGPSFVTQLFF